MNIQGLKLAVLFTGLLLLPAVKAESAVTVTYQEPLQQLTMQHASSPFQQAIDESVLDRISFDAHGRRFDISLEVNRTLVDAAKRSSIDLDAGIYRGQINGMPGSWVRLLVAGNVPQGVLWDGKEMWAIEVDEATGGNSPFIFRLADLAIEPGSLSCSQAAIASSGSELVKVIQFEKAALAAQGPGASLQIDLAVIADFEFTDTKGANVDTAVLSRMNIVDGIFSEQLGVQINIDRIDSYASNNDPFSDVTSSSELLVELANYREATPSQNSNGLSHLFTGRNLDGSTVGIAYGGALCSRRYGAGLTQGTLGLTTDALIVAHELGHNFGAPHDGDSEKACAAEPETFLMAPRINGSDTFSACSIGQMQDDVSRASCISPLAITDAAVVSGSQPAAVLLGNSATLAFEVNSVGTENLTGVSVDIVIPAGVTLDAVATTAGSCTTGGGSASCSVGSITAGSGATISLEVTTAEVGSANFVATVSADSDDVNSNNQATLSLRVDPAVDLVAAASAQAQVQLDNNVTVRPSVENRATIAASNVTVTVTVGEGISLSSASWSAGSCSITNNTATCDAGSITARTTQSLQLGLTGLVTGDSSYALAVSSDEPDRDPDNNAASGSVKVIEASSNTSGGGGGSIGMIALLLLTLVIAASARSRRYPAHQRR
jgi:hypothetical protein